MLLFCALSPKNPLGGNATVPVTDIRLQADYFIASLVGNLIPPISTWCHKTFNLTSVLLYFVHFLLFFLFTLLITQLFCWVFSNEKCMCGPIVKRLNGQSVTLHSTVTVAPQRVNITFTMISIVAKFETRKDFINFIEETPKTGVIVTGWGVDYRRAIAKITSIPLFSAPQYFPAKRACSDHALITLTTPMRDQSAKRCHMHIPAKPISKSRDVFSQSISDM